MHLAIEAARLKVERRGIGRYVRHVLRELLALRPDWRVTLVLKREGDAAGLRDDLTAFGVPVDRLAFAGARAIGTLGADVTWYPWNVVKRWPRAGAVVATVHDVAPLLFMPRTLGTVFRRWRVASRYRETVRRADALLTNSAFTAAEVERMLGTPRDRFTVTQLAADPLPVSPDAPRPIAGDYLLYVGADEPRKNLDVLVRVADRLVRGGRALSLVLCGPGRDASERVLGTVPEWVHLTGYVGDDVLGPLYRHAAALVVPSVYEGFGLPVLEGMLAGIPVVSADAASLPEVAGDAALLFPPHDEAALEAALVRLLDDRALRDDLAARGRARAACFSWRRTAEQTVDVFERVAAARR
jgi:alpha-1,3-rhamnosyl/mannosyltransferase